MKRDSLLGFGLVAAAVLAGLVLIRAEVRRQGEGMQRAIRDMPEGILANLLRR